MRDVQVILVCDAGPTIGYGHVSRMLALAYACIAQGMRVVFFTASADHVQTFIGDDFPVLDLTKIHWVEITFDPPLPHFVWVVDIPMDMTEEKSRTWLAHLRESGHVVLVDVLEAPPEACDAVLLPHAHFSSARLDSLHNSLKREAIPLWHGWEYALLHPAMYIAPQLSSPYEEREAVLWAWGGGVISCDDWERMDCARAELMPHSRGITHWDILRRDSQRPLVESSTLASWLRHARLIVGKFGMMPYEAIYHGAPMVALYANEIDRESAQTLAKYGTTVATSLDDGFSEALVALWQDTERLQGMHVACKARRQQMHEAPTRVAQQLLSLAEGKTCVYP